MARTIIQNAVEYKGKIFCSIHRHDFVVLQEDPLLAIDGGNDYLKRVGEFSEECKDISLYEDDPEEKVIEKVIWGVLQKDSTYEFHYMKDLDTTHLINIARQAHISNFRKSIVRRILWRRNA